MADPSSRSIWGGIGAFLTALLAGSHHSLHMALLSLGVAGGVLLLPGWLANVMIVVSFVTILGTLTWILRARGISPVRFWGIGGSLLLSAGVLAYGVMSGGY
jgi:hypothetical protein